MKYRKLHKSEIELLVNQGCTAEDWNDIEVVENFLPDSIKRVQFLGKNRLGFFSKTIDNNNVDLHSGIFDAIIHNCVIGNNVYISRIHNILSNYQIGDHTIVSNIGTLSHTKGSACGNGVMVAAVNENGGRKIPIFDYLSAQIAHIMVYYRQKKAVLKNLSDMIEKYCFGLKQLERGIIGTHCTIINSKTITNVKIGDGAGIDGAELLENGSINSEIENKSYVGCGVIAKDFIFCKSSTVEQGSIVERSFVGEGSEVSKGFSATDTLLFANCEMMNGEAVSVFAAPYSVSHHKSSLLIACGISFANVGSGTNMSNHAYKLGAVHQGIIERGCKFASNSYLMFPARVGAFCTIFGTHKRNPDISNLPFSYLIEQDGESYVIPAANLFRLGCLRDTDKWQKRDKRKNTNALDKITFNYLNPFVINKIEAAIDILQKLHNNNPNSEEYLYGNCRIKKHHLKKGIEYYRNSLTMFLGDFIIANCSDLQIAQQEKCKDWSDVAGLVMPNSELAALLKAIENNADITQIHQSIDTISQNYNQHLARFVLNKYDITDKNYVKQILDEYILILNKTKTRVEKEADSEFFGHARIGYGVDFETDKNDDFEAVREPKDKNESLKIISKLIEHKIEIVKKMSL